MGKPARDRNRAPKTIGCGRDRRVPVAVRLAPFDDPDNNPRRDGKRPRHMNFEFSDELLQLRDQARRFLADRCPPTVPRRILDTEEPYAADLWRAIAEMGW